MDFFEQQERARRSSRWLVVWYLLAVLSVIASYCLVAALVRAPLQVTLAVGGIVGGIILAVSAYRIWQLSGGGPAIARLLGARYLESGRCTASERRLLNVNN